MTGCHAARHLHGACWRLACRIVIAAFVCLVPFARAQTPARPAAASTATREVLYSAVRNELTRYEIDS